MIAVQQAFRRVEIFVIAYVAAIRVIDLLRILLGYFVLRNREQEPSLEMREQLRHSPLLPPIAVIAADLEDGATSGASVRNLLALRYPNHEVIVVTDGLKRDALKMLIEEFRLVRSGRVTAGVLAHEPVRAIYESRDPIRLVVVDQQDAGKAGALNAGIDAARADLVCVIDSGSLPEPDSLLRAVKPFLEDPSTIAAGGIVRRTARAPRRLLPLFRAVGDLRELLGNDVAFGFLNSLPAISGAFALFDRKAVIEAGGYRRDAMGPDMELVVRLHRIRREGRRPYRMVFVPDPLCSIVAPDRMRLVRTESNRRQRGMADCIRWHARMLFNPRYGAVGLIAFPSLLFVDVLGPPIELLGYEMTLFGLALALIDARTAIVFLIVSVGFGILVSMSAIALDELGSGRERGAADLARLLIAAIAESLGFRQLVTIWRTRGLIDGMLGKG